MKEMYDAAYYRMQKQGREIHMQGGSLRTMCESARVTKELRP